MHQCNDHGLTHLNEAGAAHMVNVSDKAVTKRLARASSVVRMRPETLELIRNGKAAKGDVLAWLNSDDFFFDSGVLAKVCDAFAADERVDVVTGNGYFASPAGTLSVAAAAAAVGSSTAPAPAG